VKKKAVGNKKLVCTRLVQFGMGRRSITGTKVGKFLLLNNLRAELKIIIPYKKSEIDLLTK